LANPKFLPYDPVPRQPVDEAKNRFGLVIPHGTPGSASRASIEHSTFLPSLFYDLPHIFLGPNFFCCLAITEPQALLLLVNITILLAFD
jgi:hypothetical protein